ncbi:hypothetical protein [Caudoviricetes sp.]|nr:hypothetical protein [Caudoviricetes sp.]
MSGNNSQKTAIKRLESVKNSITDIVLSFCFVMLYVMNENILDVKTLKMEFQGRKVQHEFLGKQVKKRGHYRFTGKKATTLWKWTTYGKRQ